MESELAPFSVVCLLLLVVVAAVMAVVVLHLLRNILAHVKKLAVLREAATVDNVEAAQVDV